MAMRKTKKAAKAKSTANTKSGAGLTFNHAIIYVADLDRALQSYANHLGFRVIDRYENAYARLRGSGDGTIAVHVTEAGQQLSSEGIRLYFEVKDLDKFCARLQSAGISFSQPPKMMPWGWQHAYLNDPDGHEISLYWAGNKRFQKTPMSRSATA